MNRNLTRFPEPNRQCVRHLNNSLWIALREARRPETFPKTAIYCHLLPFCSGRNATPVAIVLVCCLDGARPSGPKHRPDRDLKKRGMRVGFGNLQSLIGRARGACDALATSEASIRSPFAHEAARSSRATSTTRFITFLSCWRSPISLRILKRRASSRTVVHQGR
jgi:hypothetical protein